MTDNTANVSINPSIPTVDSSVLLGSSTEEQFLPRISSEPTHPPVNPHFDCATEGKPIGTHQVEGPLSSFDSSLGKTGTLVTLTRASPETLINSVTQTPFNPQNPNGPLVHHSSSKESQPVVKKTSFQITSVTTIDSSASNDGADESGDDMDESHTEDSSDIASDVSFRHTTGATLTTHPAVVPSDENFSTNDVFLNPSPVSAMGTAPVIPTSAQYGLAVVSLPQEITPNHINTNGRAVEDAPTTMVDTSGLLISSSLAASGERSDLERDHVHNRFKVVKIESSEPFRKGRWTCMDYFDHATSMTPSTTTASCRISVPPNSSPSAALITPSTVPSVAVEISQPSHQALPTASLTPPQIQQQMMPTSQALPAGGDGSQHQQLIQQQLNTIQQPQQIQLVPPSTEIQHIGDSHTLINGNPSYQNLSQLNLSNSHVINIGGIEYSNQQQQPNPNVQGIAVNASQNLYQVANQVQANQQQCCTSQPFTQGSTETHQPFQHQQPLTLDSHTVNIPLQQLNPQYSQTPPPNQCVIPQHQPHPAQSLPHGAVSLGTVNQMSAVCSTQHQLSSVVTNTSTCSSHQVTQSLGHSHNIQLQKGTFQVGASTQQVPFNNPTSFHNQQEQNTAGQSMYTHGQPVLTQVQQQQGPMTTTIPHQVQQSQPLHTQVPQQSHQSISQNPTMYIQQSQLQQQQAATLPLQGQLMGQNQVTQICQQQFGSQQMAPQQIHTVMQQSQQPQPPQQILPIPQPMVSQQGHPVQQQGIICQQPHMVTHGIQQQSQQPAVGATLIQHGQQSHPLHQIQQGQIGSQGQYHIQGSHSSHPANLQGNTLQPTLHQTSSASVVGVPLTASSTSMVNVNSVGTSTSSSAEIIQPGLPPQPQSISNTLLSSSVGVSDTELVPVQGTAGGVAPILPSVDLTSKPLGSDISQSKTLGEDNTVTTDDGDSASGTSAVAIDNKIEQAMDLVKSHLMFAVREEVEVLKERIAELMERINHLEYENTVLKASASPDTLAQLQLQQPSLLTKTVIPSNSNTSG